MAERPRAAVLAVVEGAAPPGVELALFDAMLAGWQRQQQSRRLSAEFVRRRERVVRRFAVFTGGWPWCWTPGQMEAWVAAGGWAHSTVRLYQGSLGCFLEYACDPRYGWAEECQARVGARPAQLCHEDNTAVHVADYEGRPERRPLSRIELQALFDVADDRVGQAARGGRKGWLTAFRDATLFKVIYGWGLRRTETSKLDVADFGRNPAAPEFGRFGMLNVRYGKAKKGQPPRRRNVAAVMGWAVEAVADYAENVRPRFGCQDHPALWVTERGGRVKPAEINARFVAYREALGLPAALVVHSLRHSYVSHLTEDGVDRRFIQVNVGHEADSSTAVYTHVSSDFMNTALHKALAPAFGSGHGTSRGREEH